MIGFAKTDEDYLYMIIWQGFGFLAVLIPIIIYIILESIFSGDIASNTTFLISGIILYILGIKLHTKENSTILYDKDGTPYIFNKHIDTLYYIKIEYWGIAFVIGNILYNIFR